MPQATTTPDEKALPELLAAALARIEELSAENKLMRDKINMLIQRLFGAQSEKLDPAQLLLMLQGVDDRPKAEEPVEQEDPRRSTAASPPRERGPRVPGHLPIVEEVIVPESVKACPDAWRHIGDEVTEQLDYEPAKFFRRRIVRQKYVPKDHPFAAPVIAPLQTLQDRCIAAPGLIAAIIVGKYCDHLPLYRQEQIFTTRHDVYIPRQTLAQWMALAADWLRSIYEHIRLGVLDSGYMQVDETPVRFLAPGNGKAKTGYLWACARPGGDTVFAWHTSRAAACLESIIPADYRGTLQSDGYAAYRAFIRKHNAAAGTESITLAGCWAHARRPFYHAQENGCKTAAAILHQIARLYQIENQLREQSAGAAARLAVRTTQSAPIISHIFSELERIRPHHLPQSAIGRAVSYAIEQRSELERYLVDGRIEIDNNLVENAIRPTAIGKKNWLFIGAAEAGQRGAILYTIVESCRRRGVDPLVYLRDVLTRLPAMTTSRIKDITPEAWANAQRAQTAPHRAA